MAVPAPDCMAREMPQPRDSASLHLPHDHLGTQLQRAHTRQFKVALQHGLNQRLTASRHQQCLLIGLQILQRKAQG